MTCLVRAILGFGEGGVLLEELGWKVCSFLCVIWGRLDYLLKRQLSEVLIREINLSDTSVVNLCTH